jgi:hypothetical protein
MGLITWFFGVPRLTTSAYDEDHGYSGQGGLVK